MAETLAFLLGYTVFDHEVAGMNPDRDSVKILFEHVVDGGYCIGCGACAAVDGSPIYMKVNEFGCIQPRVDLDADVSRSDLDVRQVCPFWGEVPDEDEIGRERFAGSGAAHDGRIGFHQAIYAGYVKEGDFRERGSSGGMVSWCVAELLKTGQIDGVMHVHHREPEDEDRRLFHYKLSTTLEEICANTKSQYYPIEMSDVVQEIRSRPGRYAFIGIPCFVKAMRLLMRIDTVIAERVGYCIALVCGHLKSMRWTDLLGWQVGIEPGTITRIGFREKVEGRPANEYHFKLTGKKDGSEMTEVVRLWPRLGGNWSHCFFMYEACDYCDDVMGEAADLSIGDAWLPKYSGDSRGTNLAIVRDPELLALIHAGKDADRLHLEKLTPEQAAQSQAGGLRHRREGLAYRLWRKEKAGRWYPRKRVVASRSHIGIRRQSLYRVRQKIASLSHAEFHKALQSNELKKFRKRLGPLAVMCNLLQQPLVNNLRSLKCILANRLNTCLWLARRARNIIR